MFEISGVSFVKRAAKIDKLIRASRLGTGLKNWVRGAVSSGRLDQLT